MSCKRQFLYLLSLNLKLNKNDCRLESFISKIQKMKIPLTIVEDHSDCLYQIQRLLGSHLCGALTEAP